jgi:trimeric autotransporter adhesin
MKKISFLLLAAIFSGTATFAQLTGIKNIPGDYPTVAAAISALNASGVGAGGVTFNIAAGHTETFSSPTAGRITTLTSSAANPVIFQKSGAGENPAITAAVGTGSYDGIVVICGGDNITIDRLKLIENGANNNQTKQMEWGIAILKASEINGSQYITIKNCTISLDKTNTDTKGIYSNNHTATDLTQLAVSAASGTNSNNKIYSNTVSNSYTGIYVSGYPATAPYTYYDQNCEIGKDGGNTVTNVGGGNVVAYGIYTKGQNNLKIAYNNVSSNNSGGYLGNVYGIYMTASNNANFDLYGNTVSIQTAGDGYNSNFYAIYSNMGAGGSSNTANIYNNTVTGCTFPTAISAEIFCMYLLNMGYTVNIYGNTVSNNTFGSTSQAVTSVIRYLYCQKSSSVSGPMTLHDNVVSNNIKLDIGTGFNNTTYLGVAGSGSTLDCYNNNINNNKAASRGSTHCLYVAFTDELHKNVFNNSVTSISDLNGSSDGIYNAYGTLGHYYNNTVQGLSSSAAGNIFMAGITQSSGSVMYFYNNMVSDLDNRASESTEGYGWNTLCGINVEQGAAGNIQGFYYNTVYINTPTTASTFGSAAFFTFTLYGVDLRNNIFINTSATAGTNGKAVGIRARNAGFTGYSSNYNCIYAGTPSATRPIFTDGTSTAQTLPDYKTLVTPQELQSVTEMPPFISASKPYNIHLQANTATQCEAGGISVYNPTSITTDFDNQARYPYSGYPVNPSYPPNAPDIGADEIGGTRNDLTAPAIVYTPLGNTASTINRTLIARITDGTGVPTSGNGLPRLYWKKNSGAYTGVTAVLLGGSDYMFTFGGGVALGDVISYYVVAQDTKTPTPNVGAYPWIGAGGFTYSPPACSTPPSFPYTYTIVQSISGTFHVGVGKTYTTLTAAANDLNTRGMVGPVTFLLDDNVYNSETYPITFLPNSGSSTTNTVTIKPNPGAIPVFSASVSSNPMILFKGLDYVTIDGSNSGGSDRSLTYENTSSSSNAHTIGITNNNGTDGSTYITLKNCKIMGSNSSIITETYLIIFNQDGGLNGGRYNNCVIENNEIKKAKYAIKVQATSANRNNKLQIINNIIGSNNPSEYITRWGIDIEQSDSTLISGNDIMGPAQGSVAPAQFGIIIWNNNTNTRILKNRIHDWISQDMSSIGIKYSDDNSTTPTEISNNVIYNIGCYGMNPGPSQNNPYGIFIRNGGNLNIWNNSIYLSGGYLAGNDTYGPSSSCMGIYDYVTGPLDIRNNILRNSMTNPIPNPGPDDWGKAYGIQLSVSPTVFSNLDNNEYYIDGFNGQIAQYFNQTIGIIDFPDLLSWQTYTGKEANGINADPLYNSTSDLKLQAGSPAVGMAVPIAQVTTDFEGTTRSATYPTIGAYEYAPPLFMTWTGLASTAWNTAGNWSPVQVPKYFTEATIPTNPAGGQVFPIVPAAGGPFSVKKLQVENGATVIMQVGSTLKVTGN